MNITLRLPLPPRGCSKNGYKHWRTVSAARRGYREECGWEARAAWARTTEPPAVKRIVSLMFGTKHPDGRYAPKDVPNAIYAASALFDGLVDAGMLVDDSHQWMQLGSVAIDSTRGPFVLVTIEEAA